MLQQRIGSCEPDKPWSLERDFSGKLVKVGQKIAKEICEEKGMRLPSKDKVETQIKRDLLKRGTPSFWTSSVFNYDIEIPYIYSGKSGSFSWQEYHQPIAVRCVAN